MKRASCTLGNKHSSCLFVRRTIDCLGILTGSQLFSLNKDELKAVCGDEGGRVYCQVTVQKGQLEVSRTLVLLMFYYDTVFSAVKHIQSQVKPLLVNYQCQGSGDRNVFFPYVSTLHSKMAEFN